MSRPDDRIFCVHGCGDNIEGEMMRYNFLSFVEDSGVTLHSRIYSVNFPAPVYATLKGSHL